MALFDAVFEGRLDEVYRLVFEDADVRAPNAVGNQPLHAAAHRGEARIAEVLLRAGADPNAKGRLGNTPLHYAAKEGHLAAVRALLAAGADASVRNGRGNTPKDLCMLIDRPAFSDSLLADLVADDDGNYDRDDDDARDHDDEAKGRNDTNEAGGSWLRQRGAQPSSERVQIATLLDDWVIRRCTFLAAPGADGGGAAAATPPTRRPLLRSSSTNSSSSSATPSNNVASSSAGTEEEDDLAAGLELLRTVKPLIAQAHSRKVGKSGVLPSRTRAAESSSAVPLAPGHDPTGSGSQPRSAVATHESPEAAPSLPTLHPTTSAAEEPQAPAPPPRDGYFVEIDGRRIFVALDPVESESDEDEGDGASNAASPGEPCKAPPPADAEHQAKDMASSGGQHDTAGPTAPPAVASHARRSKQQEGFKVKLTPGPVGLGMLLEEGGRHPRVSALHPLGPALEQGVECGDLIVAVNGTATAGMFVHDVKALLAREAELNHELELEINRS